jgi:hypothetical protein
VIFACEDGSAWLDPALLHPPKATGAARPSIGHSRTGSG